MQFLRPPPAWNKTLSITLTGLSSSNVWSHILGSHATHEMNMLTPTSFLSMYPETLLPAGVSRVRTFNHQWDENHVAASGVDARRVGLTVESANDHQQGQCTHCPRELRQLAGAHGCALMLLKPSPPGQRDVYARYITSRFTKTSDGDFGPSQETWQFSKYCLAPNCPSYNPTTTIPNILLWPSMTTPHFQIDGIHVIHAFPMLPVTDALFDPSMDINVDDDALLGE